MIEYKTNDWLDYYILKKHESFLDQGCNQFYISQRTLYLYIYL